MKLPHEEGEYCIQGKGLQRTEVRQGISRAGKLNVQHTGAHRERKSEESLEHTRAKQRNELLLYTSLVLPH